MKLTKECLLCGSLIEKKLNESLRDWENRRKFCSRICTDNARRGTPAWNKGQKMSDELVEKNRMSHLGQLAWNKGLKIEQTKGAGNGMWKGDNASYFAIHSWIYRTKGKPEKCVDCGKSEGRIEWSNKDHQYRRIADDYEARCKTCHERYDDKNLAGVKNIKLLEYKLNK